jgi:hypothetical protein
MHFSAELWENINLSFGYRIVAEYLEGMGGKTHNPIRSLKAKHLRWRYRSIIVAGGSDFVGNGLQ